MTQARISNAENVFSFFLGKRSNYLHRQSFEKRQFFGSRSLNLISCFADMSPTHCPEIKKPEGRGQRARSTWKTRRQLRLKTHLQGPAQTMGATHLQGHMCARLTPNSYGSRQFVELPLLSQVRHRFFHAGSRLGGWAPRLRQGIETQELRPVHVNCFSVLPLAS